MFCPDTTIYTQNVINETLILTPGNPVNLSVA